MADLRIAVFASGGGSNFQALVTATQTGTLTAEIGLCVSNRKRAGVLKRAENAEIPHVVLSPKAFDTSPTYTEAVLDTLQAHGVNFIALAGYLQQIPPELVAAFRHRMVNIHPALLPKFGGKGFYGKRVHAAVLEAGETTSGATVHMVDEAYDTGPIILQRKVPVLPTDTPETLAERVLRVEHQLYPEALQLFAEDRIEIQNSTLHIHPIKS